MKKLTIFLVLFALPVALFAENKFSIENSAVAGADTGTFYISMENDIRVNGANIIIKYDPALITPLHIRPLDKAIAVSTAEGNRYGGDKISFLVYDRETKQITAGRDRIFEVAYIVNEAFVNVDTATQVVFHQGTAIDSVFLKMRFEYTHGAIRINGGVTGIEEPESELPVQFALYQNYPNPFNPSTTIQFDLPAASIVTLKIFNTLGQQVYVVFDKKQYKAGRHKKVFVLPKLASGVYFYKMIAESIDGSREAFIRTSKMLLVK